MSESFDPYPPLTPGLNAADCGMCLTAADIGVGGLGIAYAHPGCPHHGSCAEFVPSSQTDGAGRVLCQCGAYEDEHFLDGESTPFDPDTSRDWDIADAQEAL